MQGMVFLDYHAKQVILLAQEKNLQTAFQSTLIDISNIECFTCHYVKMLTHFHATCKCRSTHTD